MSSNRFSDDPRGGAVPFVCDWRPEALAAASVHVSGELDIATSGRLDQIVDQALQHARLVLVNLHRVTFMDGSALHVIVNASGRAREAGGRLLVVAPPPHAEVLLRLLGTRGRFEVLRTEPSATVAGSEIDHDRRSSGSAADPQPSASGADDVERRIHPLANPVNARVVAARVMAVPDRGLWLHGSDGVLHRAWAPRAANLSVPAGTPIEVYLDGRGEVNGWRDPRSGLAINQRRLDRAVSAATEAALACQGACGVVWLAPAAAELTEHDERCLTCAGPLARR